MTSEEYMTIDRILSERYSTGHHEGYKKGIAEGNINNGSLAELVNEAYDNGINEAWEFIGTLERLLIDGMGWRECFGSTDFYSVVTKGTYRNALKRYEEYKKRQKDRDCENCKHQTVRDSNGVAGCVKWECEYEPREEELQVGDEVIFNGDKDDRAYITHMIKADGKIWCSMIHSDGSVYEDFDHMLTKTGKHVDIGEMLKQIQEG